MGVLGPGIFSDDLACDLRAEFREMIADGVSAEKATRQLMKSYGKSRRVNYDDDDPVFWTALAAVQWQCGRLVEEVKEKALEFIAHGGDVHRWQEEAGPKDAAKRRAVLEKLRKQLLSPQPASKKIKEEFKDCTDWKVGHAVGYRLQSGRWVVLRVIAVDEGNAIVDVCDWVGDELPDPKTVPGLPRRRTPAFQTELEQLKDPDPPLPVRSKEQAASNARYREGMRSNLIEDDGKFAIYAEGPRDFPTERVRVIGVGLPITESKRGALFAHCFGGWRRLDSYLEETFGLK